MLREHPINGSQGAGTATQGGSSSQNAFPQSRYEDVIQPRYMEKANNDGQPLLEGDRSKSTPSDQSAKQKEEKK